MMLKTIEFTVDSMLRMSALSARMFPEVVEQLRVMCTHSNPAYKKWRVFKRGAPPPKILKTWTAEATGAYTFPRGIIPKLKYLENKYVVNYTDKRVKTAAPKVEWKGDPARGYQRRLIQTGLKSKEEGDWTGGVWRAPAGSGKTSAVLELIAGLGLKTLVVCPTSGVFNQWQERVRSHLGVEPGVIKGSKSKIGDLVTLVMQQTLWRHVDKYADQFGAVIFDEAQLASARTYQSSVTALPALFRLCVSADEHRADGLEFLVYDQFGPVSAEVTDIEVKASGGIVDVKVVIVPTEFQANWYKKLKPDLKFEKRGDLLESMAASVERNAMLVNLAVGCLASEGEQVCLLTSRRAHAQLLVSLLGAHARSVLLIGADVDFEQNRKSFAEGLAKFAVGTYQAVGVGFESHRELARGIFASPVASNVKGKMQFKQFLGRYARPAAGKDKAVVYYLLDVKVFGKRPAALIRGWVGAKNVFVKKGDTEIPVSEWLFDYKENDYDKEEGNQEDLFE